ncbi:hypothetical protein OKA04_05600 [Luteolibacter flavescens]|uniref:Nucleotidyltransferase family protein n=1 Tax=Luteolibacter flavescens TaxID=1859460 RepID=A0ABT3FLS0_9BACT|nr:hypothetical protein [Luteolibacter flavescens]MCW1884196.1 hypothetical protein [Luteolibacter flavescens]
MDDGDSDPLNETRPPTDDDLARLAARLNELGVDYVVVGGFAIISAGYVRATMDIDLLIDVGEENEQRVIEALSDLPERAAAELRPGEVADYVVVRVCDEFTVDLMAKACGLSYREVAHLIEYRDHLGVRIPFASPKLLWKTKQTHREKDAVDRIFLRKLLEDRGEWPVE